MPNKIYPRIPSKSIVFETKLCRKECKTWTQMLYEKRESKSFRSLGGFHPGGIASFCIIYSLLWVLGRTNCLVCRKRKWYPSLYFGE